MTSGHESHSLETLNGKKTPLDESANDAVNKAQDVAERLLDKAVLTDINAIVGHPSIDALGALSPPAAQAEGMAVGHRTKIAGIQR